MLWSHLDDCWSTEGYPFGASLQCIYGGFSVAMTFVDKNTHGHAGISLEIGGIIFGKAVVPPQWPLINRGVPIWACLSMHKDVSMWPWPLRTRIQMAMLEYPLNIQVGLSLATWGVLPWPLMKKGVAIKEFPLKTHKGTSVAMTFMKESINGHTRISSSFITFQSPPYGHCQYRKKPPRTSLWLHMNVSLWPCPLWIGVQMAILETPWR